MIAWACPDSDQGFADHPLHGAAAQRKMIERAISRIDGRYRAIDVGAHIGLTAAALAQHFRQVLAFEPVKENFECLKQNVKGLPVACMDYAVGAEADFLGMSQHNKNSGCWHLKKGTGTAVVALDALNLRDIDFIKIDVEGMEGEVITGAREVIARDHPAILLEDNGLGPKLYGDKWVNPKVLLAKLRYEMAYRENKDELWLPR